MFTASLFAINLSTFCLQELRDPQIISSSNINNKLEMKFKGLQGCRVAGLQGK